MRGIGRARQEVASSAPTIDFVVMWVDGSDPAWQKARAEYLASEEKGTTPFSSEGDVREQRYRDWGILRYWFRGVEAFAPWVRRIHFVTWGHLPTWLDVSHPKLNVVRHEDFMPPSCLPTFNSRALELNLHRMQGLAEHFVYFNDDFLIINAVRPEDFFMNGLPRDMLALQPVVANPDNPEMSYVFLNNALAISRHFDKRESMRRNPTHYLHLGYPPLNFFYNLAEVAFPKFTGFYTVHGPSPFLKSTFEEVWEQERGLCETTSATRVRGRVEANQYLVREWQKQTGAFCPANIHRDFAYLDGADASRHNLDIIRHQKRKMVCINDSDNPFVFEHNRAAFQAALDSILPAPCSFELEEKETNPFSSDETRRRP